MAGWFAPIMSMVASQAQSGKVPTEGFTQGSNVGKFLPFKLINPYTSFGGNSFLGRGNTLSNELLGGEAETPRYFTPSNPFFNVGIKTKGTEVNQPSNTGSTGGGAGK